MQNNKEKQNIQQNCVSLEFGIENSSEFWVWYAIVENKSVQKASIWMGDQFKANQFLLEQPGTCLHFEISVKI